MSPILSAACFDNEHRTCSGWLDPVFGTGPECDCSCHAPCLPGCPICEEAAKHALEPIDPPVDFEEPTEDIRSNPYI